MPRQAVFEALPRVERVVAPLPAAHCQIDVTGVGTIGMEDDYLPHVVQCENGGANLEALKAQAIAARSVAYYAIETNGSICDGQGCQVYSCGANPSAIHIQAVQETSGMYLSYSDVLTYAFFVAGDSGVQPPSCIGSTGTTEHWVTYNEGKTGSAVEQTALGSVFQPTDASYGQNRGCMGQWSARCLENNEGYDYRGILKFFYGDDIGIPQAQGSCVDSSASGGGSSSSSGGSTGALDGGSGGGTTIGPLTTGTPGTTGLGETGLPPGTTGVVGTTGQASSAGSGGVGPSLPPSYGADSGGAPGCGCRAPIGDRGPTWLVLGFVALVRTRRRSRRARAG